MCQVEGECLGGSVEDWREQKKKYPNHKTSAERIFGERENAGETKKLEVHARRDIHYRSGVIVSFN